MTNIQATEAKTLLDSGDAILIDVREPDEFKAEHIAGAISIPLSQLEQGVGQLTLPESKTIICQCLKGKRGEMACERIKAMGVENRLLNVDAGIEGWKNQDLPVIAQAKQGSTISLFRQVQIIVGSLIVLFVALGVSGVSVAFYVAGFFGAALLFAGISGWCGLAMLLMKMPWNKS